MFGLKHGERMELLLPLYDLCDEGDYWEIRHDMHTTGDLGMSAFKSDRAVYIWVQHGDISGIAGTYVDDSLNAGNEDFQKHTERTLTKFGSKPRLLDNFDFYGTQVDTSTRKNLAIITATPHKKIELYSLGCPF